MCSCSDHLREEALNRRVPDGRKPIPVQGTSVVLDTPEAIDAWIEERKKRWPSAPRVEEKKQKLEEAAARGQLNLLTTGFAGRKRRRVEDDGAPGGDTARGRGRGRGRGSGRRQAADSGWRGRGRGRGRGGFVGSLNGGSNSSGGATTSTSAMVALLPAVSLALPPKPPPQFAQNTSVGLALKGYSSSEDEEEDEDALPEAVSSKVFLEPANGDIRNIVMEAEGDQVAIISQDATPAEQEAPAPPSMFTNDRLEPVRKPRLQQPKRPLQSLFTQRGSLLRNVCSFYALYVRTMLTL